VSEKTIKERWDTILGSGTHGMVVYTLLDSLLISYKLKRKNNFDALSI
jgi:hypothetical protein